MTEKMNPEVKAKWVAALRSGEYKQGSGCLRSDRDQFCCLGVLCDLQGSEGWSLPEESGSYVYRVGNHDDFELPPMALKVVVGLDWTKVDVVIGGEEATLYNHNDAGRTFAEIADAIEAQL